MAWVRVDDQFYNHPKLAGLGSYMLPCVGLHVLALCYCNAYLTDGLVPKGQVPRLVGDVSLLLSEGDPWELVTRLVMVGLWDEKDEDFVIHDYLDYNPSKAEVLQTREKRSIFGRIGGLAKAKQVAKQTASKTVANVKQKSAPSPSPFLKSQKQKLAVLADGQFLDSLKANPAYQGIDIERELGKMDAWLSTPKGHGRQKTRGFIVNWLNKIDRPVDGGPSRHPGVDLR